MSSEPMFGEPRPVQFSTVPGGASAKARGYADGYAHGWAAGAQAAAEQAEREREAWNAQCAREKALLASRVDQALAVLAAAAQAANARLSPVLEESREQLVGGAVQLAESLLAIELTDHGVAVRSAVGRALQLEGPDRVVRIRLNPADLAALAGAEQVRDSLQLPADVDLVPDPGLAPGDAMSELPEGMLDARIGQALARVREELGLARTVASCELPESRGELS